MKIGPNVFLFDVELDPLERINLINRHPDIYQALTAKWNAWNRTMLPEDPASYTYANDGAAWADHIRSPRAERNQIDDGGEWPRPAGAVRQPGH